MCNKFNVGDIVKRICGSNHNMSDGATFKTGEIGKIVRIGNDGWPDVEVNGNVVRANNPNNLERVNKFRVGDRVVGNASASEMYGVTKEGWRGEVIKVMLDGKIEVRGRGTGDWDSDFVVKESAFERIDKTEAKREFKIGDRVRITANNRLPHHDFGIGETVEIIETLPTGSLKCRRLTDHKFAQYVNRACVEPAPVVANKIVVTTDGKTTTAKMFNGRELVGTATAVCSPDDEFDFKIGAGVAVSRLLNTEEKPAEPEKLFPIADIKAGYLLKVRNTDDGSEFYMTVVPGSYMEPGELGCCCPGAHWWPVSDFGTDLKNDVYQIVAVYDVAPNRYLLDNKPDNREMLWSR
jgi:hypothetical protein